MNFSFFKTFKWGSRELRQCAMIITAGVTGHKRKMRDIPQRHRKSTETEVQRRRKKLTGRTNWYKIKRQNQNRQKPNTREKGKKGDRKETGKGRVTTENKTPSSVLFMERTEEGKLATELKEKEREINQIGRKKIKVVERNGAQLGLQIGWEKSIGYRMSKYPI